MHYPQCSHRIGQCYYPHFFYCKSWHRTSDVIFFWKCNTYSKHIHRPNWTIFVLLFLSRVPLWHNFYQSRLFYSNLWRRLHLLTVRKILCLLCEFSWHFKRPWLCCLFAPCRSSSTQFNTWQNQSSSGPPANHITVIKPNITETSSEIATTEDICGSMQLESPEKKNVWKHISLFRLNCAL